MMTLVNFVARVCLVCLFPPSAYDKLKHRQEALEQARSGPLPDAPLLIDAGMVIETMAPLCIVIGKFDHIAAVVLAGFCAVTAVGYHQFWTYDDLQAPDHRSEDAQRPLRYHRHRQRAWWRLARPTIGVNRKAHPDARLLLILPRTFSDFKLS